MSSPHKHEEPLLPTEAHSLKKLLIDMCEEALTNIERLRDRQEISLLIETLNAPVGSLIKRNVTYTGIVRTIDELGRIVLPKELRKTFNIKKSDSISVFVEGDWMILDPYKEQCHFCGSNLDIMKFKSKSICETCIGDLFSVTDLEDI